MSTYRSSDMSWRPVRFSPFVFNVEANKASVNASSVGAPTSLSAPAGDAVAVPVTVLDVHGNVRAPARGELAVSFVSSPDGAVTPGIVSTDNSTGLTFATASLTRADRTHLVEARLDGALVPGSRSFALVTVAGRAHPPSSRISGAGVHSGGVSGESREVYVDIRDRYGNPIVTHRGSPRRG